MKPPRKKYPPRARVGARIPADLRHRLAEYNAAKGVYEGDTIRLAIEQYLDGMSDMTLLYRRIDGLHRTLARFQRTLELHGEFLNEYVLLYLKNTPPLPDADLHGSVREAARRYKNMLERVTTTISAGKTWVDDLPKDTFSPVESLPSGAEAHNRTRVGSSAPEQ